MFASMIIIIINKKEYQIQYYLCAHQNHHHNYHNDNDSVSEYDYEYHTRCRDHQCHWYHCYDIHFQFHNHNER